MVMDFSLHKYHGSVAVNLEDTILLQIQSFSISRFPTISYIPC